MRKTSVFLLLTVLTSVSAFAQDAPPENWTKELTGKISATQAGFDNWAEGGINSLAFSSGIDGKAENVHGAWTTILEFRAGFGFIKQDTTAFRKAEDLISLKGAFKYQGEGFFATFRPTVAASARSQFYEGFNFDKNPFAGDTRTPPVKVSDALAPATLMESLGLTYAPTEWFTQRLGVSAKQTIVKIERLRPLYSMRLDQSVRSEVGLEAVSELNKEIFENVHYKSTLGLFAAFNNADMPDILWENLVTMKVNSWLAMNFEWVTLMDKDRSASLQFKEVFSIGVTYRFI